MSSLSSMVITLPLPNRPLIWTPLARWIRPIIASIAADATTDLLLPWPAYAQWKRAAPHRRDLSVESWERRMLTASWWVQPSPGKTPHIIWWANKCTIKYRSYMTNKFGSITWASSTALRFPSQIAISEPQLMSSRSRSHLFPQHIRFYFVSLYSIYSPHAMMQQNIPC